MSAIEIIILIFLLGSFAMVYNNSLITAFPQARNFNVTIVLILVATFVKECIDKETADFNEELSLRNSVPFDNSTVPVVTYDNDWRTVLGSCLRTLWHYPLNLTIHVVVSMMASHLVDALLGTGLFKFVNKLLAIISELVVEDQAIAALSSSPDISQSTIVHENENSQPLHELLDRRFRVVGSSTQSSLALVLRQDGFNGLPQALHRAFQIDNEISPSFAPQTNEAQITHEDGIRTSSDVSPQLNSSTSLRRAATQLAQSLIEDSTRQLPTRSSRTGGPGLQYAAPGSELLEASLRGGNVVVVFLHTRAFTDLENVIPQITQLSTPENTGSTEEDNGASNSIAQLPAPEKAVRVEEENSASNSIAQLPTSDQTECAEEDNSASNSIIQLPAPEKTVTTEEDNSSSSFPSFDVTVSTNSEVTELRDVTEMTDSSSAASIPRPYHTSPIANVAAASLNVSAYNASAEELDTTGIESMSFPSPPGTPFSPFTPFIDIVEKPSRSPVMRVLDDSMQSPREDAKTIPTKKISANKNNGHGDVAWWTSAFCSADTDGNESARQEASPAAYALAQAGSSDQASSTHHPPPPASEYKPLSSVTTAMNTSTPTRILKRMTRPVAGLRETARAQIFETEIPQVYRSSNTPSPPPPYMSMRARTEPYVLVHSVNSYIHPDVSAYTCADTSKSSKSSLKQRFKKLATKPKAITRHVRSLVQGVSAFR